MTIPEISPTRAPNRLVDEKSPYLLQHAYNPVDWFPWGEEAFEKARREEKPIFLSIGYSTCYWCHVMEREVFENDSIADQMNRYLVCIKVDREERPDVDRIYMAALQAMAGSGGWPMSMFLTPDLKPFFGATYIPPTERFGRPGFVQIIESIQGVWTSERIKILDAAGKATEYLNQLAAPGIEPRDADAKALDAGFKWFQQNYDSQNAGFGSAPKFPRPVAINFLLRYSARYKNPLALEMSLTTLRRMANGGMYDHVGGGFHRYATDGEWHVPHFEKMLYDQAQLVIAYLEAFQITHDKLFSDVAEDILSYVLRELGHPDGGFYSAEDAESAPDPAFPTKKEEGAYYVWTKAEIDSLLTPEESLVFCGHYGVEEHGNVQQDPHAVFKGKNILHIVDAPDMVGDHDAQSDEQASVRLASARAKLFARRRDRPRCHLDDKILASWNGLMVSALARASQVLGNTNYLAAAERTARFIMSRMRDASTGMFYHRYRENEARYEGQLEDYAFFLQALIDLYEASFNIEWLRESLVIAADQNRLFYDHEAGGYFDTSGRDNSILVRTKEWYDGAEPSGNSIAILNLLRLAQITNSTELTMLAAKSLSFFGQRLESAGHALPQMLVALDFFLNKPSQIIIAGKPGDPHTSALLRQIHACFVPSKVMMLADGGEGQRDLSIFNPFIGALAMIDGRSTAYVCKDFACQLPTSDPSVMLDLLSK